MFSSLNLKKCYRSKTDNLDTDFIIPILSRSIKYDRGTGYFSINGLVELSNGIIPYIKNGGNIRLITSIELNVTELETIKKGYDTATKLLKEIIIKRIEDELINNNDELSMDLIVNLIASKRLDIKIAYLPNGGIYHEKIGYFEDEDGEKIWFFGSINETYNAYKRNVESVVVLKSWQGDAQTIDEQVDYFEALWKGDDESIKMYDFPTAAKEKLFSKYKFSSNVNEAIERIEDYYIEKSKHSETKKCLYKYQQDAIDAFFQNDFSHFYEMATGTGKTFTAIKTIEYLLANHICEQLYVTIVVPQIDLQVQWEREFDEFNISCYFFGGNATQKNFDDEYNRSIIDYFNTDKYTVAICVYDTYFSKFQNQIDNENINKMIIVDEAHDLSENQINKLSTQFRYRLGLSATPEKHDKEVIKKIINYFTQGRVDTYKYTIDDAIMNGFLSHYKYYPILINLEEEEFAQYQNYTYQLIVQMNAEHPDEERIQEIRNNRSVIVKKATNKLLELKEMIISKKYNFCNSVVYCGQGKDPTSDEKIIDTITSYLAIEGGYRVSQFVSKTVDRDRVLAEFEHGYYDTLVAIKCFDQGIDVPKLDKIFIMASDALNRQTIQRRGRVLRKCKETGKDIAFIYDFIVLPLIGVYEGMGIKNLVSNEINRATEYMRLADNRKDIEYIISDIKTIYNISEESEQYEE